MQAEASEIDVRLLPQVQALQEGDVILPLQVKREDVSRVKALKLSDDEVPKVDSFQAFLFDRGYLPRNNFASLFVYTFNLAFTLHKQAADAEADEEAKE